jgi:ribosomal protein L19
MVMVKNVEKGRTVKRRLKLASPAAKKVAVKNADKLLLAYGTSSACGGFFI